LGVREGALSSHPSKEISMTRTLKAISALVLGGMLLVSTACEDKECKDALAAAKTASEAAAKTQAATVADLNATKAKLAATTAELAQVKKDMEAAKAAPKAEEPAPAAPAKKGKGKKK
jgi:hypothetical protein